MRLDATAVAEIRAAQDLYRPIDVARHYGIHRSHVKRIWDGEVHAGIAPAEEPPNVITRRRPSELSEDIRLLLSRGKTPDEVAEVMGISIRSVYAHKGVLL